MLRFAFYNKEQHLELLKDMTKHYFKEEDKASVFEIDSLSDAKNLPLGETSFIFLTCKDLDDKEWEELEHLKHHRLVFLCDNNDEGLKTYKFRAFYAFHKEHQKESYISFCDKISADVPCAA